MKTVWGADWLSGLAARNDSTPPNLDQLRQVGDHWAQGSALDPPFPSHELETDEDEASWG